MKYTFTTLFALGFAGLVSAQNLEIRDTTGAVISSTIMNYNGLASDFEIVAEHYEVWNVGSSSVNVKCKRIEAGVQSGTASALCWTVCSPDYAAGGAPVLTAPSSAQSIAPGAHCDLFVLHYKPQGVSGTSTFRVVFFNTADANDTTSITTVFNASPTSVPEAAALPTSISAYPNPASNYINIDVANFNDKATLRITDALGVTVKTALVNGESTIRFSTADLREGVYFYSLITNNKAVITRRMIVTR